MFSEKEIAYLKSQRLARLATASSQGQPDVAPVGFEFDDGYFYIGGLALAKTLKYKNALANPKAAMVIDDLASLNPWMPRGLKIQGAVDIVERKGGTFLRVKPEIKWTWGIEEPGIVGGKANIKRVKL